MSPRRRGMGAVRLAKELQLTRGRGPRLRGPRGGSCRQFGWLAGDLQLDRQYDWDDRLTRIRQPADRLDPHRTDQVQQGEGNGAALRQGSRAGNSLGKHARRVASRRIAKSAEKRSPRKQGT